MGNQKWVAYREGEVIGIFKDRKESIKYLKELLTQTLKDFENQDKTDEFDYKIDLRRITIEPIKKRESYLGL